MPDTKFYLKSIHFKSASDSLNTGICSVRCELSNGESSGELSVGGARAATSGVMNMPWKMNVIKKVQAYADEQGVFNIFMKDAEGKVICSYDPKNYGEIDCGKYTLEPY